MTTRRAFTMIELVLAGALGLFIVGAVFGIFTVMRECENRSRERAEALHQLASLQEAMTRSLRTLVVLDKPVRVPQRRDSTARGTAGAREIKEAAAAKEAASESAERGELLELPRLILEKDPSWAFPRLEMVLSGTPMAMKVGEGHGAFIDAEDGGGVRAAFESEPGRKPGTRDIWLRAYDLEAPPGSDREVIAETLVCKGLVDLTIGFWKGGTRDEETGIFELEPRLPDDWATLPEDGNAEAWSREPAARSYVHLPAYVEVEAQTWQGIRGRWFFEVKWMVARNPDGEGPLGQASAQAARAGESGTQTGTRTATGGANRGNDRRGSGKADHSMDNVRVTPVPAQRRDR